MSQITDFISEAREKGYPDARIKKELLNQDWPVEKIDAAFESLNPKFKSKNQICLYLSDDLMNILEKRAKKNMQTISEQIEEIIRKSCVTYKGGKSSSSLSEKLDDNLIALFSRKNTGPKGKRKTQDRKA